MAIYDTMQYIKPDVSTICIGIAASMASVLVAAGAKGALLPAQCRSHDSPDYGRRRDEASDIKIHAEHILKMKDRLNPS